MHTRRGSKAPTHQPAKALVALSGLMAEIGRQFRHPRGGLGRAMGWAMCLINARANALAVRAMSIAPHDRILELGCGPGQAIATMSLLAPYGRIAGIDQSEVMLAQARRRNARAVRVGQVHLSRGGFNPLPSPANALDKVLGVNVAYFWTRGVAAEVRRSLRPGGCLVLYVTDEAAMRHWAFAGPSTHRHFDAAGLKTLLIEGGFADSHIAVLRVDAGFGVPGLIAIAKKD